MMTDSPALQIPLRGVQAVEASAGTGKTELLALLMLRAVLAEGVDIREVLAVTFTRKATRELRERLQNILLRAQLALHDGSAYDGQVQNIVQQALQTTAQSVLQQRLQQALYEVDQAAVYTIHGFCQRVLGEYPLWCDSPGLQFEILNNEAAIKQQLAWSLWREWNRDVEQFRCASMLWRSPEHLSSDIVDLLSAVPDPPIIDDVDQISLQAFNQARANTLEIIQQQADELEQLFVQSIELGILSKSIHRANSVQRQFNALRLWASQSNSPLPLLDSNENENFKILARFARPTIKKGAVFSRAAEPFSQALSALIQNHPAYQAQQTLTLKRFVQQVRQRAKAAWAMQSRRQALLRNDDVIELLAAALRGPHAAELAAALQSRFKLVLIDEFQDTDLLQWSIFSSLFAHSEQHGLLLIGDPKQAIYAFRGGDIRAYQQAQQTAQNTFTLDKNYRSQSNLVSALNALYTKAKSSAFIEHGIEFKPAKSAASIVPTDWSNADQAHRSAAPMNIIWLPTQDGASISIDEGRQQALQATAIRIAQLLSDAKRQMRDKTDAALRRIEAKDIAILLPENADVDRMLQCLAQHGIPASGAGRRSVYETQAARELLQVMAALLKPDDSKAVQTACATALLGFSTEQLLRFQQGDDIALQTHVLSDCKEQWQRYGVLALLDYLLSRNTLQLHKARWRQRADDSRQLGELLQLQLHRSLNEQYDSLQHAIHDRTRREDDDQRSTFAGDGVQVMTLHKSKGLQFAVVCLPMLWYVKTKNTVSNFTHVYSQLGQRELFVSKTMQAEDVQRSVSESIAERRRQLYVGLTRASHALELVWGCFKGVQQSALHALLHGEQELSETQMQSDIQHWSSSCEGAVQLQNIDELPTADVLPMARSETTQTFLPLQRDCRSHWWVHSFSQLQNFRGKTAVPIASDEEQVSRPEKNDFAGAAFGLALHELFERQTQWSDYLSTANLQSATDGALRAQGFAEADIKPASELCQRLFRNTLNTNLPEGARLADLPANALCNEMEFHFALRKGSARRGFEYLQQQGLLRVRALDADQQLEGLMNGKIDLLYTHANQFFVADFKSNWLPEYNQAQMARCMLEHDYYLQAAIYTLAVHKWLQFRLGKEYSYQRDFGGVRYLFCRGLGGQQSEQGVLGWKPELAFIEELQRCLGVTE